MNRSSFAYVSTLAIALPVFVTACSSASSGAPSAGNADASPEISIDAPAAPMHYGVLIVGTLASDVDTSHAHHDALARGGEGAAQTNGDVGHSVFLGTTLLGTKKDEFLALDRWIDGASPDAFYAQPDFAKSFATLFSGPPSLTAYVVQPTWRSWGSLDVSDATARSTHYWVVVRGTMQSNDTATNKASHDAIAGGAQPQADAAGDVGHTVFIGRDDPTQYFSVDTWKDPTNIEAFYSNADFQKAFSSFFASRPTIGVYASTDWYQW